MPRRVRHYLPGQPYHIVQRGNNREACFIEPENYLYYLQLWKEVSAKHGVAVHVYCLMTNHIHFLLTPSTKLSISNAMKQIGSRYAQYINKTYNRTGTLWEGRHKASLVQSDKYFLVCSRYIELNPVVAGMVRKPEEYRWSSYLSNAWNRSGWIMPHEEYLRLGNTAQARCEAYRELFRYHIDNHDIHKIEEAAHYCHPVGDDRFKQAIEQQYGIRLGQARRGRPEKSREG